MATVQDIMEGLIAHSAQEIFDAVKTVSTEAGTEEIQPRNDEEWAAARFAAMGLAESANLLLLDNHRADKGQDWTDFSLLMVDRSIEVARAAEAQDPELFFDNTGYVYEVCQGCHAAYLPEE